MDRVLAKTKVKERFTERDPRAKVTPRWEKAHALLLHADVRTTARIYGSERQQKRSRGAFEWDTTASIRQRRFARHRKQLKSGAPGRI
jgi:hypothetical protein